MRLPGTWSQRWAGFCAVWAAQFAALAISESPWVFALMGIEAAVVFLALATDRDGLLRWFQDKPLLRVSTTRRQMQIVAWCGVLLGVFLSIYGVVKALT